MKDKVLLVDVLNFIYKGNVQFGTKQDPDYTIV